MVRLYARPAGFALFRWGGEYTWMTTGPVSSGVSEPLPLPTTMIGALLGTREGAEFSEDSILGALREKLGCRVEALRGPYYPGTRNDTIYTHLYPGRLVELSLRDGYGVVEGVVSGVSSGYGGTALRYDRKSVARGLLYSVELVDAAALEERGVLPEVSMDALGCGGCEYASIAKLGGDMRVARLSCGDTGLLENLLESRAEAQYCLVASPILLDDRESAEKLLEGEKVEVGDCTLKPVPLETVERLLGEARSCMEVEKLAKQLRLRVEILSPGVEGSTGFPREPLLAVMPGAVVECECSREALKRGVGLYSRIGFGTLLPIKEPTGSRGE